MEEYQAPPDIETGLVTYLRAHGVDASTVVPTVRRPGMVRLIRTGGSIPNAAQDAPRLLVQCWDSDPDRAHRLARRVWVRLMCVEDAGGVEVHHRDFDPPIEYPDPNAVELARFQFTGSMRTAMEPFSF